MRLCLLQVSKDFLLTIIRSLVPRLACSMPRVPSAKHSVCRAWNDCPSKDRESLTDLISKAPQGALGGTAQAIGGPFDKEGGK